VATARKAVAWSLAGVILFSVSCDRLKTTAARPSPTAAEEQVVEVEPEPVPVLAVCVADRLAFWSGPTQKEGFTGYYIKNGELVTWLGVSEQDKTDQNREFYKVRLSDGTEGWALATYIVPEAKAAAVTQEVTIYRQNNLISRTDEALQPLDIVAVLEEQEDWVRVAKGNRNNVSWIKPGNLTFAEVDVAVAYHARQAQKIESVDQRRERLQALLDEEAFQDSIFVPVIRAEVTELDGPTSSDGEQTNEAQGQTGGEDAQAERAGSSGDPGA
jgi:hypothetical protein